MQNEHKGGAPTAAGVPPPSPVAELRPATVQDDTSPRVSAMFGLGVAGLRKAKQLSLFESLDDKATEYKPATAKMRLIDTLRYHKPTAEEQLTYNLPSSMERLNLHKHNDVMSVCLARKGKRFSSEQIQAIASITTALAASFEQVDASFKALSPAVCRYKLPPSPETPVDEVHAAAMAFHARANEYIALMLQLKETVLDIRAHSVVARGLVEVPLDDTDADSGPWTALFVTTMPRLTDTDPPPLEFESKAKAPLPTFLFVLIQKYRRERRDVLEGLLPPAATTSIASSSLPTHPWWPTDAHPPLDSLAQFALFLAAVLLQRLPFLRIELDGIVVLLQVLKCDHTAHADALSVDLNDRADVTQYTLSHRIFDFLVTVRELRSIPKRKELLESSRRRKKKPRRCPETTLVQE
ncbi:Aste57867_22924 [Aphanomyces stellatus]|uniref:Aste57867_22924 protein n=1 Tax=Aphanomyces stellatus TaxID=120398 RepID=A0A485LR12_9STRA|nr:hypothetical protein As57867_022853 [Aphanomyces stellatus]VFT99574.1 Aste57867_22924 [Aphanomyces stellatus]